MQIKYVLSHMPSADYQRQELESELIAIQGMAAANAAVLDPKKADPELAERQRLEAESRAEQLRKMAAVYAEPSADELATRRKNAVERRRILLDQCGIRGAAGRSARHRAAFLLVSPRDSFAISS